MNTNDTISFLATLEPAYQTHQFLWTGNHPDGQRLQEYGTIEQMLPRLVQRNEQGYGIFIAINAIDQPAYDGGYARRRNSDISRVRSCFADWDDPNKPVGNSLPLNPTMTVSTSPGKYHFHWCVDDCPLDQFEGVQRGIAQLLGTDKSVHDLARELRVPGFLHTKDLSSRSPVRLLQSGGPRYTLAQLQEAFPYDASHRIPKFSTWDGASVERRAAQTAAVIAANYLPRQDGGYNIRCPWWSEHTTPDTASSSTYWPPSERNSGRGSYVCKHAHCQGRMVAELDAWIAQQTAALFA